jgi:hypothetical protein
MSALNSPSNLSNSNSNSSVAANNGTNDSNISRSTRSWHAKRKRSSSNITDDHNNDYSNNNMAEGLFNNSQDTQVIINANSLLENPSAIASTNSPSNNGRSNSNSNNNTSNIDPYQSPSLPVVGVIPANLGFKEEDLNCSICYELPHNEIYQCQNGHLMCATCYKKLVDSHQPRCATCRIHLNRERPTRNRFAELILSQLLVPCSNSQCTQQVRYSELNNHIRNECGMRKVVCKHYLINCDWSGRANQAFQHESNCEYRVNESTLSRVKARHEQVINEQKKQQHTTNTQVYVTKMLQKRVRDITLRDIVIERCNLTNYMVTKVFKAVGIAWEVYLDIPKSKSNGELQGEVRMHLKIVSKLKRRTTIELFVLGGPTLDIGDFAPALRRVIFKPHVKESEPFPLALTAEQAKSICCRDSVHLRIGFLDVSRGSVKNCFTTVNGPVSNDYIDSASDTTIQSAEEGRVNHNNNNNSTVHEDSSVLSSASESSSSASEGEDSDYSSDSQSQHLSARSYDEQRDL